MNKKRVLAVGSAAAVSLLLAIPAFADTTSTSTPSTTQSSTSATHHGHKGGFHKPGVIGEVTAINGDSLTVTGKNGTVYTVDATNATIQKGFGKTATTLAVSGIALNDTIAVQGTVTGDAVVATKIMDGLPTRPTSASGQIGPHETHQPLANASFGTITSINGSTITISRMMKGGTTSTVTVETTDTTTYKKNGQADTVSDLAVGQRIVAMGTKDSSGNITDATSVNIMVRPAHTGTTTGTTTS